MITTGKALRKEPLKRLLTERTGTRGEQERFINENVVGKLGRGMKNVIIRQEQFNADYAPANAQIHYVTLEDGTPGVMMQYYV